MRYGAFNKLEKGIVTVRDLLQGKAEDQAVIQSRGKSNIGHRQAMEDTAQETKLCQCLLEARRPRIWGIPLRVHIDQCIKRDYGKGHPIA